MGTRWSYTIPLSIIVQTPGQIKTLFPHTRLSSDERTKRNVGVCHTAACPLSGSEAPLLLLCMPAAGALKLAALKQNSAPDAAGTHSIRYGP